MKRGEESGHIKITLRGDSKQEHITITRKIDTRNKSEWLFNGKVLVLLVANQRLSLKFYDVLYDNVKETIYALKI